MDAFHFHAPDTLAAAAALLGEYGDDARPMAGGTALTLMMKQSLVQPDHLVSLHCVTDGRGIAIDGDVLRIGALVTQREVERSPLLREHAPLLANAYGRVGTVRIRNVGTVGGGLAHGDPAQDPQPALLALGAQVRLLSTAGERVVPMTDFCVDYYETAIEPGELVVELLVPTAPRFDKGVYLKYLPRTQDDYATVAVAALGTVVDGRVEAARVGLGAVAPTPLRATAVEEALVGGPASADAVREAAALVADLVDPLDDARGSAAYKRDMAVVFTRRALEHVFGLSGV